MPNLLLLAWFVLVLSNVTAPAGARFDPHFFAAYAFARPAIVIISSYLHLLCSVFADPHWKKCTPSVGLTVCSNKFFQRKIVTQLGCQEHAPGWHPPNKHPPGYHLQKALTAANYLLEHSIEFYAFHCASTSEGIKPKQIFSSLCCIARIRKNNHEEVLGVHYFMQCISKKGGRNTRKEYNKKKTLKQT